MRRSIIKFGYSLGLTLPSQILESFNVKKGDIAEIKVVGEGFLITFPKNDLMESKAIPKALKELGITL